MKQSEIILSHRTNLRRAYGGRQFLKLERAIGKLKEAVDISGVDASILWTDAGTPGEAKEAISGFEKTRGVQVSSLLIVGGDDTIPFFRVKNEVDDGDSEILSDAPYACRLGEWTLPERAVGRFPGTGEADFLLRLLARARKGHLSGSRVRSRTGFGYSTSQWRLASKAVYTSLGLKERLKLSPPTTVHTFKPRWLRARSFLYFNLHGLKEKGDWFGERGPADPVEYPQFPRAVAPELIPQLRGGVVFSEACYGGYVLNKDSRTSLALRFLEAGADCFVGASAIAYGPHRPPSTEADLLCKYFYQYVMRGSQYGNSLMNAKRDFVKKMFRIQGYLDEDDRKTLAEFNLFGDPCLSWRGNGGTE